MTATAPAGWYLAPSETTRAGDRLVRYWDGHAWAPDVALESDRPQFPPPGLDGPACPLPTLDAAA